MTFLAVVDGDAGGWRIDRDALTDAIRAWWSGAEIDSMHEDGTCLYMDVWEEDAIWWAIVFRRLTPVDLTCVLR